MANFNEYFNNLLNFPKKKHLLAHVIEGNKYVKLKLRFSKSKEDLKLKAT